MALPFLIGDKRIAPKPRATVAAAARGQYREGKHERGGRSHFQSNREQHVKGAAGSADFASRPLKIKQNIARTLRLWYLRRGRAGPTGTPPFLYEFAVFI